MKKTGMRPEKGVVPGGWNTPVYNALKSYTDSGAVPFHMPGHKLGCGIPDEFLSEIVKLDLTEIPGTDDLHKPESVLKEAHELAAAAFGARRSYFVVNGSTGGLHAAIAAVCKPGQRLITGRDSHSSVINGMLIAGVYPYYIMPEFSESFGISAGISPDSVERALDAVPDAAGVLITRPNYYGVCSDVEKIARIVHSHGKVLIVDEAHGSHLAFSKRLPISSLEAGADICVQSAHKTLPAFTQGAYLHVGTDRVDTERLEYFLDIYQTTSPSFILMAFLDIARAVMQRYGDELLDRLIDSIAANACRFTDREIMLLDKTDIAVFDHDITRVAANVSQLGITGYEAEKVLRMRYNIQAEMSDLSNIIFICTVSDSPERIDLLFSALDCLNRDLAGNGGIKNRCSTGSAGRRNTSVHGQKIAELMSKQAELMNDPDPRHIMNSDTERVKLENAAGRISKCTISVYPPGTALVCPGETISGEMVTYLKEVIGAGSAVHGVAGDGTAAVLS
jgi:arginine decarboxylase